MKLFSTKGSSPPVIEAAQLFSAHHGIDVVIEACSQGCAGDDHKAHENHHGFTSEVTAGEYDLAIAGSEADMDDLEMTGIVVEGSRHSLGLRETAILIPAENPGRVRTFEDLFRPGMRVAISTTRFHPNLKSIPLPEEYRIYRSTCISVLKGVMEKGPGIQSFIDFLCSREGRNIFERHGWVYDPCREKD